MTEPLEDQVRILHEPKFVRPTLIAAWPGISNVALEATGYLKEKLGAQEFAEVESSSFFELGGVYVEKNLVQPPRLPQNKFYYWERPGRERRTLGDLIIFIGEAQPTSKSREFANKILDLSQDFGVKDVYTFAAALVSQFSDQSRVWAAATDDEQLTKLEEEGLGLKGDFYIAGMNGLLLSVARERGVRATCLLGETPRYMSEMRNPIASKAVLEAVTRLLKIEIDMTEMNEMAEQAAEQIEEVVRESRRQFIKDFTVPLWERSEEEGQGEG
jgi:proteasome assembly chaperone (PAC2) family protein